MIGKMMDDKPNTISLISAPAYGWRVSENHQRAIKYRDLPQFEDEVYAFWSEHSIQVDVKRKLVDHVKNRIFLETLINLH